MRLYIWGEGTPEEVFIDLDAIAAIRKVSLYKVELSVSRTGNPVQLRCPEHPIADGIRRSSALLDAGEITYEQHEDTIRHFRPDLEAFRAEVIELNTKRFKDLIAAWSQGAQS